MVAITVILAAVIGTFVLSLGGDLQQTPQAQLTVEAVDDGGTQDIQVSHDGGDTLSSADLSVSIDGVTTDNTNQFTSDFSVGESKTLADGPGTGEYTVTIIHQPSDSILVERTVTV